MVKLINILEKYKTKKTAKKHGRSYVQQEYRNKLAKELRNQRKNGESGRLLAKALLDEEKYHGSMDYWKSLGRGRKAGKEIAFKLIEKGCTWPVVSNIENFEGLDHKEIAEKLIENGEGRCVARCLENFEGLNHKEIAGKLIEKGYGEAVAENIENFEGLDHKEIAEKLIEKGYGKSVVGNLEKFEGLDEEIADKLIDAGLGDIVYENPEKFGLKKEK